MAQLSDDCFAFGGPMMSVDEAVAIIAARVSPVQDIEAVLLAAADGRVLAKDISAPLPLPPFTNSAVDGYAVRSGDLPQAAEKAFPVVGRVQAGASAQAPVEAAHAVRIFTGAPMPRGADTVFMQEDVRLDQGSVVLPAGLKPGANVRPAGEDVPAGHCALKSGRRLRPQDVALVAAFGLTHVEVRRRIRVAVFSTGNELVSPGVPRGAAQLFDSNRFMLMAMLVRLGCEVSDLGILGDDRMALASALQNVADAHDLVLTTGGVSTGEEDHVKTAVEMRPTVLALAGAAQQPLVPMPVRAAFTYKKKIARREYVRVNLRKADDGVLEVAKFPREGAGLLSSLVDTDGLVELGEDITRVEPGQTVGFLSYANLI